MPSPAHGTASAARSVQTDWVDTFLAIADHAGIRSAAHALHLSQSRVSAHLAALERVVGVRLVERGPRGARLTRAGEAFRTHARLAVDEIDSGVAAARQRAQATGRVGICPQTPTALLAAIAWPSSVRPAFAEVPASAMAASLHDGTFDVVVGPLCCADDTLRHRLGWTESVIRLRPASGEVADAEIVVESELTLLCAAGVVFDAAPTLVGSVALALALAAAGRGVAVLAGGSAPTPSLAYRREDDPHARIEYGVLWAPHAPEWVNRLGGVPHLGTPALHLAGAATAAAV